jgi:hypothetical protein
MTPTDARSYCVYGLHVRSSLALPELDEREEGEALERSVLPLSALSSPAAPNPEPARSPVVTVRQGHVPALKGVSGEGEGRYYASPTLVLVDFPGVARFQVRDGSDVVVDPYPGAAGPLVRTYLLGIGLATVLHQRGHLVLHAGGVAVDDRAVLFVGQKGAGKSTFTATMHDRGHPFVTDDIAPIRVPPHAAPTGRRSTHPASDTTSGPASSRLALPVVAPGFRQQKLWPDAARHLGRNVDALPRLHEEVEKRFDAVQGTLAGHPLPVAAVYVLEYGAATSVEPLGGYRAFEELVRHSFLPPRVFHRINPAQHFALCQALLQDVTVYRLVRPKALDVIAESAELVESHQRNLRRAA